ncbi:MAG: hypothetical protein C4520_18965 [Candidatus Abyssobacteria bacterium SURF_5]|uniref:YfhO family protein n=1 Tax=Abyssobacteria bacterium (strain SURF_5) TaxID=2093360 RepID=A0A3A4N2A1_ABYX5|nr:MAG: hypothetical protein C4520_18965 [Candidatus Abyssubacteria bacterium SURF_5]
MRNRLLPALALAAVFSFLVLSLLEAKRAGWGLYANDIYSLYLPCITFIRESMRVGIFPLWNPYLATGAPFLPEPYVNLFYPVNWLAIPLEPVRALLAIQVATVLIGFSGMILYARYLKLNWAVTVMAAGIFGYAVAAETQALYAGSTYCWTPIIFLLAHRLFDRPRFTSSAALAASLAICFIAGFYQFFFYICLLLCIYLFAMTLYSWRSSGFRPIAAQWSYAGIAFLLLAGLAATQLFPTIELSSQSVRTISAVSKTNAETDFLEIGVLGIEGHMFGILLRAYYFGSALFFFPFALASRNHRKTVVALSAALVFLALFLLGHYFQFLSIFTRIPLADVFERPSRMVSFSFFPLAALSGIGLSELSQMPFRMRDPDSRKLSRTWLFALLFIAVICALAVVPWIGSPHSKWRLVFYCAFGLSILFALPLAHKLPLSKRNLTHWVMALVVLLDVFSVSHGSSQISTPQPDAFHDQRVEWAKENAGQSRVLVTFPESIIKSYNTGTMFRFNNLTSYSGFTLKRWSNYILHAVGPNNFEKFLTFGFFYGVFDYTEQLLLAHPDLLGLTSLQYALTRDPIGAAGTADQHMAWHTVQENPFFIYENRHALPRAYLVDRYVLTRNEQESLEAIEDNMARLRTSVVLENAAPSFLSAEQPENPGAGQIDDYGLNQVRLQVETERPALLVLTDSYYPGWQALVDGVRRPIWRANSLFRAVEVPPGNHEVIFKYRPLSLFAGIAATLTTVLLATPLLLRERREIKTRPHPRPEISEKPAESGNFAPKSAIIKDN